MKAATKPLAAGKVRMGYVSSWGADDIEVISVEMTGRRKAISAKTLELTQIAYCVKGSRVGTIDQLQAAVGIRNGEESAIQMAYEIDKNQSQPLAGGKHYSRKSFTREIWMWP